MSLDLITSVLTNYLGDKSIVEYLTKPRSAKQARSIFPVANILGRDEYRSSLEYKIVYGRPMGGIIAEGATEYPNVSYGKEETRSVNILKLGSSQTYTAEDNERIRAAMGNIAALTIQSATVALMQEFLPNNPSKLVESLDNAIETIAFYGEKGVKNIKNNQNIEIDGTGDRVFGILNSPDITNVDVATSGTGTTSEEKRLWANKSGEQIYADITNAIKYIRQANNSIISMLPDTMLVSPDSAAILRDTYRNQYTGISVYEQIKQSHSLNIIECEYIAKQHEGDVNRFIMYKKSPDVLSLILPQTSFIQLPMEQIADVVTMRFKSYTAGLAVKQPSAILICNGI